MQLPLLRIDEIPIVPGVGHTWKEDMPWETNFGAVPKAV